jgi:hypothetical protein
VSPSLSRFQAVLLGAIVLAGLGLAGYGLFALGDGQWPWSRPYRLQAGFTTISGVSAGTRVRVKGHDAGEVQEVRLPSDPGGKVALTLRLDPRFRDLVRTDARAQIVPEGVFGGKVIEIDPGTVSQGALADGAEIATVPSVELAEMVAQLGSIVRAVEKEKGKVGELIGDTDALIKKSSAAMESIHQIADGVKEMWGIRSYVKDPPKLLGPPGCECKPWWFAEADLFDPGRDRLTAQGRERLNDLVRDVAGLTRHSGSQVTIVAYNTTHAVDAAQVGRLTQNQSEVVASYLKGQGAIHKDYGILPHKVTALGSGESRPEVAEKDKLPPAGLGVLVFVPQGK